MSDKSTRITVLLAVLAVAAFLYGYWATRPEGEPKPADYPIQEVLYGARIYSTIPPEKVASWNDLALYDNPLPAALSCNLEFSSLKPNPQIKYQEVEITDGESGIYIQENKAAIKGANPDEILYNCHVFSCLLSNITCPRNLEEITGVMWFADEFNVILDANLSSQAAAAYTELLAPLSYYQSMRADVNGDGVLDDSEVARNTLLIRPYLMSDGSCVPQPLRNLIQNLTVSNESVPCDFASGVFIEGGGVNGIMVDGERIFLRGDTNSLRASAIILGDVVAPDWLINFRKSG